jgi:hypothetical protein
MNEQPLCFKTKQLSKPEVQAIKAMYNGEATPHQQKLCLAAICNKLARAQDLLYIPNEPDQTTFLNGRAFVGQQLLKTIKVPIQQLQFEEDSHNDN